MPAHKKFDAQLVKYFFIALLFNL